MPPSASIENPFRRTGACIIGIAGFSCSGKSTLAQSLASVTTHLHSQVLLLDAFYHDLGQQPPAHRALANFDHPDSIEWPWAIGCAYAWSRGYTVRVPIYDFPTHSRVPGGWRLLQPGGLLIVDGLHALWSAALRGAYRLSVFVQVPHDVCLARRVHRDTRERGRSEEYARRQYERTVRRMADEFVLPTARYADLVLDGESPATANARAVLEALQTATGGADVQSATRGPNRHQE